MRQAGRHVAVGVLLFQVHAERVRVAGPDTRHQVALLRAHAVVRGLVVQQVGQVQAGAVGIQVLGAEPAGAAEIAARDRPARAGADAFVAGSAVYGAGKDADPQRYNSVIAALRAELAKV